VHFFLRNYEINLDTMAVKGQNGFSNEISAHTSAIISRSCD